ncbi:hypothetical protein VN12_05530 [Pirellula sp. SH-Sr6A]|uniref:cytochrome c n=1 Tax=Pirellula sp. SH-Sr6A TaxID=1632865 RepID=UPI00078E86CE|nr:cytochrome c [Pirellula sp. SH-Sr6A]AMV31559.1 hypothetical protein VN12_05530 [Pirellula sp. SH-Sr6A]
MCRSRTKVLIVIVMFVLHGCAERNPTEPAAGQTMAQPEVKSTTADGMASEADSANQFKTERITTSLLPNAWRIHPKVISGGLPEGDAAFRELAGLGIKTIISVDGAKPDVSLARAHGLRYVHMPHGYDGISNSRGKELAKAVRDLPGPIYVHCHHGKHRSPTAAAVACIGAGLIATGSGEAFLTHAGTGENYRGLYASAREAIRFENAELDRLAIEFEETVDVSHIAEAMVEIENRFAKLKKLEQLNWDRSAVANLGLDASHEALLLRESYAELIRVLDFANEREGFEDALRSSEIEAKQLEESLTDWEKQSTQLPPDSVRQAFALVAKSCASCHKKYRDVPLSEK